MGIGSWYTISYPQRDGAGNPRQMVDWNGTTSYNYDANSRLDDATYPGQSLTDFNYDWVGNRLTIGEQYDAADRFTAWQNHYSYTYYGDGGMHEVRDTQQQVVRHYTYHPSGLLNEATYPGGSCTNTWDAAGNRVQLTIGEDTYTFVYEPTAGIPAVIEEVTPDGSVYYYREPSGSLIARRVGVTGDNWRYYHFDELGSTRALTDEYGYQSDSYTYDAWGNLTEWLGTTPQPYQFVGELGYYTHYQDVDEYGYPKFRLLQLGVRFYDPEIGRFTQRDALKDGINHYLYARARATTRTNPSGLMMATQPSCDSTQTATLEVAYDQLFSRIMGSRLGASPECIWKYMRQYLDDNNPTPMLVVCIKTRRQYGRCAPSVRNDVINIGSYSWNYTHNDPRTSLPFVVCHELMHQARYACKLTDPDKDKEDQMCNELCESLLDDQQAPRW